MAEPSFAGSADRSLKASPPGSRTLQGRIEAIGIHELLRLSAIKGSTGMLLVFNDQTDAQLYYEQGHLVAAVSGSASGPDCLSPVLLMRDGEFEFTDGLTADAPQCTPGLHEMMMAATKEYFEREIRARRSARQPTPEEEPRLTSGVHRVASPPQGRGPEPAADDAPPASSATTQASEAMAQATPNSSDAATALEYVAAPSQTNLQSTTLPIAHRVTSQPLPLAPAAPAAPSPAAPPRADARPPAPAAVAKARPLAPGQLGTATLDSTGHLLQRNGDFSPQDLVVSALALRIAGGLGRLLGVGELQGFEIHGTGDKVLFCDASKAAVIAVKMADTGDTDFMWEQVRQ